MDLLPSSAWIPRHKLGRDVGLWMQVSHDYFENAMAFFTVNIYIAIKVCLSCTTGLHSEQVASHKSVYSPILTFEVSC